MKRNVREDKRTVVRCQCGAVLAELPQGVTLTTIPRYDSDRIVEYECPVCQKKAIVNTTSGA
jgi:hypothetical protein